MKKKDDVIVHKVVEKVLKDFDFEIDDVLESKREDVEQAVKDGVLENIDDDGPPYVEWIQLVELDEAEAHRNERGDFLSN